MKKLSNNEIKMDKNTKTKVLLIMFCALIVMFIAINGNADDGEYVPSSEDEVMVEDDSDSSMAIPASEDLESEGTSLDE